MGSEPLISQVMRGQAPVLPCFEPSDFHPHASTSEIAEILQISTRRVRELVADGVLPREDRGHFDIAEASRRYIAFLNRPEVSERRAASLGVSGSKKITSARGDLIRAQAARAELRLARERGQVVPISLFRDEVGKVFQIVRHRLLALPRQVALDLEMQTPDFIEARLDTAIRQVLTALAQSAGDPPAGESESGLHTSAKPAQERNGAD